MKIYQISSGCCSISDIGLIIFLLGRNMRELYAMLFI